MNATMQAQRRQARRAHRRAHRLPPHVHAATRAEGRNLFDYQTRKLLGIAGDEFLRRWDAGEYRDVDDETGRKVTRLLMLMPFARRTTG